MGNVAIFSGNFAKLLKANINLFGKAYILTGTDDPTLVATDAPKGSILMRQTLIGNGELYKKNDDGLTTNWVLLSSSVATASEIETRLEDKLADSSYAKVTAIDFLSDTDDHVDGASTGEYSVISKAFELDAAETLVTTQLASGYYLSQDSVPGVVSLTVFWDENNIDPAAVYEVSRNGGADWQVIDMEQVEDSDTFEGEHIFTAEVNDQSLAIFAGGATNDSSLNATDRQAMSQAFTLTNSGIVRSFEFEANTAGTPLGLVYVRIESDNAGLPSGTILGVSQPIDISTLPGGVFVLTMPFPDLNLAPGTYHWIVYTDAVYKANFSGGANRLNLSGNNTGTPTGNFYDGASYTTSGFEFFFDVLGLELDLRARITASTTAAIKGYGLYYDKQSGVVNGVKNIQEFSFFSNSDNDNIFALSFVPDPDLLRVYHVETGQVYIYPSYQIDANEIIFPAGTFSQDTDQRVTLRFVQTEGQTFDGSDYNAANIATLQDSVEGIGNVVKQVNLTYLTATTGTPGAGQFRSSVIGRAPMVDVSNDLFPRRGTNRLMTHGITLCLGEQGPLGQPVYKPVNDIYDQVRFYGAWQAFNNSNGPHIGDAFAIVDNVVEVSWYGTGLHLLTLIDTGTRDIRVSIDGGAEGSNIYTQGSAVVNVRKYNTNAIIAVAHNLTRGLHTAKLRWNTGSAASQVFGFQFLNENTTSVVTSPGSAIVNGIKRTRLTEDIQSFNSGFDSGVLGTKGGRAVWYIKEDGTIGKSLTPTNASQLDYPSADHTNEEVAAAYTFRNFGAGRADDLSTLIDSASTRIFGLDDDCTALTAISWFQGTVDGVESIQVGNINLPLLFNFEGTGLDLIMNASAASNISSFQIDGGAITNLASISRRTLVNITSGLSDGHHTCIIRYVSGGGNTCIERFIVYQQKKPVIPASAVELMECNITGNFVANTSVGQGFMSGGVTRHGNTRGFIYSGSWSVAGTASTGPYPYEMESTGAAGFFERIFWGNAFDLRGRTDTTYSATSTVTLQSLSTGGAVLTLNSANFPGLTTGSYGGMVFNYATGNLAWNGANQQGAGMTVSGLTEGYYKLRVTNGTANSINPACLDVHSSMRALKRNNPYIYQAISHVAGQSYLDIRPLGAQLTQTVNQTQALAVTADPTTTSTLNVPIVDMVVPHYSKTGFVDIGFDVVGTQSSNNVVGFIVMVNGRTFDDRFNYTFTTASTGAGNRYKIPVNKGWNTFHLTARVGAGTFTASYRSFSVRDI